MSAGIGAHPVVVPAAAAERALLGVYRRSGPVFVGGRGCRLVAQDGREYLDFTSGIGVNALGYGDEGLAAALAAGAATGLIHSSNLYRTLPGEALAAELVARSFADRVFFCNSGAEANEAAFKFARRLARARGGEAKHEVVALTGSFHGRLFGSLAATDRPAFQEPFRPLMPGVRFVAPGDLRGLAEAVSRERTAAIIAEPVQGEGGVRPLDCSYIEALREHADAADAVLIFDEVQCGLGRTGHLFAHEHGAIAPDLLTLAKPLAGGLPMGAVLLTEEVASAIQPGDHATTFGGGPLVAGVALAVVRRIGEPAFLEQVRARGRQLARGLAALAARPAVAGVRGRGLMWGIELTTPAAPVMAAALAAGLLLTTAGEKVVRLLPPLVIDELEVERGLRILAEVLP
jgi:acetylornithine/N-succinyldiaminopimelate aminotransferase